MFDRLDRSRTDVVLIVDDVPDNLSLLHDALDDAGYTVLVATHGEAALQRGMSEKTLAPVEEEELVFGYTDFGPPGAVVERQAVADLKAI